MVFYKTEEEIQLLKKSCDLVSRTLAEVAKNIKPGVTTLKLDTIAEQFIRDNNGIPGFLGYRSFPNTLCVSVNEQVVHGIPSSYLLKEGDIVSIDCGVILNSYYGDSAYTFIVGDASDQKKRLLSVTKEALYKGIEMAIEGNRIGDIGNAVQEHAEKMGYSVVRELVGHGIGKNLHEKPEVPNYGKKGSGLKLKTGLVIAIEPMINFGKRDVIEGNDGWTISTKDKKPSAHFEHTIAVRKEKAEILTTFDYIEQILN